VKQRIYYIQRLPLCQYLSKKILNNCAGMKEKDILLRLI